MLQGDVIGSNLNLACLENKNTFFWKDFEYFLLTGLFLSEFSRGRNWRLSQLIASAGVRDFTSLAMKNNSEKTTAQCNNGVWPQS